MAGQDKNIDNTPQARDDAATATEAVSLTIDVLANDLGGGGKSLYSVSQTAPAQPAASGVTAAGAQLSIVGGRVVYLADSARANALGAGETLTDTFTYTLQMGKNGALSTATVTVTLTGTNDGPVAVADWASTGENQAVTVDVLANDTDVDAGAVKTLVSVDAPKGSAAVVDGKVVFTPGAAFDGLAQGETQDVTLTYVMRDEHGATSTASVVVTVTGANDGPVAVADRASTGENQGVVIDVLANDTDVDAGAVKTLVSVDAPKGSAAVVDGKVVFTPGTAFDGLAQGETQDVTLTYVMRDEHGATSTASVVVTVTGANDVPVAVADGAATGENQAVVIDVLANDTDVDAGALKTLVSVEAPKGSAAVVDGKVVFTPGTAFDGLAQGETQDVTLTYVMRDEHGATSTASVVVTVTGANDAPAILAATTASGAVTERPDGAADESTALHTAAGAVAFADLDLADVHSATVSPAGTGYLGTLTLGAVDQAANRVDWTFQAPDSALDGLAAGEVRTQTYAVQLSDGRGGMASQTITVTLTGAADPPPPPPPPPPMQAPAAGAARPIPPPAEPDVMAFVGSTYRLLGDVRDANGDGVLDTATVSSARTLLSGFSARGGDVADVDGDGDLDAVVSNFSGRSALLLNAGDPNGDGQADFTVAYLALAADGVNQWQDAKFADIDGDGDLDIVEGGRSSDRLHLNRGDVNGDGVVDFTTRLLPGVASKSYSYGVDVADLNGDGRQDIVLTTYGAATGQTTLAMLLNLGDANGDGTPDFRTVTLSTADTTLAGIDIADMNGDGRPDIAVAAYTGGSYVLQGRGDVDGDGAPDFASSGTIASSAYMGTVFADMDGDGDLDVLFGDRTSSSELALNLGDTNGDGVTNFRVVSLGRGGDGIAVSDFDGDGDADLLFSDGWVGTNRGDVNGDGMVDFAYAQIVSLTGAWDVVAGDFLA
ncbi:Ig-like domain-containing protein [Phenylobacterium sp.]|uniref:Ig-like domain-containing protein n=1 Tax=Phenylobacterium sp. TaxID=1871053 RepID=UPI002C28AD94|nr:tandem-95 repeat protein [Phenylobacterium sp.]HVI31699.1 tandem-95 repeat protein [Phenylobacterium sp.]